MASSTEKMPDHALLAGPTLVGCMMMYLVFGVLLAQSLTFMADYHRGTGRYYLSHAVLMGTVFAMAMINLCFVTFTTWCRFIIDAAIPAHQWVPPTTTPATGVLNGLIACAVQLFFARKVYLLGSASKNRLQRLPGLLIAVLAIIQLGAALATAIIFGTNGRKYDTAMDVVIALFLSSTLAADIAITASMVAMLSHYKRRSAFTATKTLLNIITLHTVENAAVTTLCAGINMICVYARDDNVHIVFQYLIGQLYATVLVISLNRGRAFATGSSQHSGGVHEIPTNGFELSTTEFGSPLKTSKSGASGSTTTRDQRRSRRVQVSVVHQIARDDSTNNRIDADVYSDAHELALDRKTSRNAWDEAVDVERGESGRRQSLKGAYSLAPLPHEASCRVT